MWNNLIYIKINTDNNVLVEKYPMKKTIKKLLQLLQLLQLL